MNRFLMLVGVAVVAAAMYVAASPASHQATGVTTRQFNALKKQVASLSKKLKTTKSEADAAVSFIGGCFITNNAGVWGVSEFGDPNGVSEGYQYQPPAPASPDLTTALDFDGTSTPQAYLQAVDPQCVQTALKHRLKQSSAHLLLKGLNSH